MIQLLCDRDSRASRNARLLVFFALVATSACNMPSGIPLPTNEELTTAPLGEVQVSDFAVEPSASSLTVAPDLTNLAHSDRLDDLSDAQIELLAKNDFVILHSMKRHMYELYLSNQVPYVTSDAVFHAWHVLLADTLRRFERAAMLPVITQMAAGACLRLKALRSEVPADVRPDVDIALRYWAKVWLLADPEARILDELGEASDGLVEPEEGQLWVEDPFAGGLDPSVFIPQAGYGDNPDLVRYFKAVRYMSMARLSVTSPSEARQAMLVSLALWDEPEARPAWQKLDRLSRFLAGMPEDINPNEMLRLCRQIYGRSVSPRELASTGKAKRLLRELEALPRPQIEDRLSDRSGEVEPVPAFRVLSPGVTLRALAFDAIGDTARPPSGLHMAALLGSVPFGAPDDSILLQPARDRLEEVLRTPSEAHDLNTSAIAVLAALSQMEGEGYPAYARSAAWRIKITNTQLGAWSQVEHDTFLYAKMAYNFLGIFSRSTPFGGSVEPAPEFFARLADVVHRTRTAFHELGAFDAIAASTVESDPGIIDIPATEEHFLRLESLLGDLVGMAEAVLADHPFDEHQMEVLETIGDTLEELSLEERGTSSRPMSTIVRVHRGLSGELFVGTGRPLEILVAVPWGQTLHLARGAVYSYYEFLGPSGLVISDKKWKSMTSRSWTQQEHRPWIEGRGLGVGDTPPGR